MKVIIQRVSKASVTIEGERKGRINKGLVLLVGIGSEDTKEVVEKYAKKIIKLRIFEDKEGKTNLSLKDVDGELLVISQFTLYANSKRGNRPSFIEAARPELAIPLYELFVEELKKEFSVKTGIFGADMKIESINDGPVTIILEDL